MLYKYAYIVGCLILFLFWLFIFLKRKDLRKEMVWASFVGMPFGFIDFFLVPTYWNPDSIFDLIKKYGVGIESFIFLFLMAGISSVIYEFLWKKKPIKIAGNNHHHFSLLFSIPLAFIMMTILYPTKAIYNFMIIGAVGAVIIAYSRKDLWKQIFFSGFIFSFLYFIIFALVNLMFSGFVEHSYNLKNTWNILILKVPLEEIVVAFFCGAFWSSVYEYTKNYRERKICKKV